jgi:hypothetical protein
MKHSLTLLLLPLAAIISGAGYAQNLSLASTLKVYVFPTQGQDAATQSKDEAGCYDWAVSNTGSDPFKVADQEQANQQQAQSEQAAAKQTGQGSAARVALRGAAAGALIGEIANDDAGDGAAWGAAAGAIRGRRVGATANAQAQQQAAATAGQREQATDEQLENFKKAFSVCLEAKEYMVKY